MPRYLVYRSWDRLDPDHMARVVGRMMDLAKRYEGVVWNHSHPSVDAAGDLRTFCVYDSSSSALLLEHGMATGHHAVDEIMEVVAELGPDGVEEPAGPG